MVGVGDPLTSLLTVTRLALLLLPRLRGVSIELRSEDCWGG